MNLNRKQRIEQGEKGERLFCNLMKKQIPDLQKFKDLYSEIDYISISEKTCYEIKNIFNTDTCVVSIGVNKLDFFIKNFQSKGFKFIVIYIFEGKYLFKRNLSKEIKKYQNKKFKEYSKLQPLNIPYFFKGICNQAYTKKKLYLQIPVSKIYLMKFQRKIYEDLFQAIYTRESMNKKKMPEIIFDVNEFD